MRFSELSKSKSSITKTFDEIIDKSQFDYVYNFPYNHMPRKKQDWTKNEKLITA